MKFYGVTLLRFQNFLLVLLLLLLNKNRHGMCLHRACSPMGEIFKNDYKNKCKSTTVLNIIKEKVSEPMHTYLRGNLPRKLPLYNYVEI